MSFTKRILYMLYGYANIAASMLVITLPEEASQMIIFVLTVSLFVRSIKSFIYYFNYACYMVGGVRILFRGILLLDFAIFLNFVEKTSTIISLGYLIAVFCMEGVLEIIHALDAGRFQAKGWKLDFALGLMKVIYAVVSLFYINSLKTLSILYAVALLNSAWRKFAMAFQKPKLTAIQ